MADLYRRQGDTQKHDKILSPSLPKKNPIALIFRPACSDTGDDDYTELQKQLYQKIQENTDRPHYGELLQWTFIQKKEYDKDKTSQGIGSSI
ncbi:MAG: hypothetical protein U0T36_00500 [Saprospiraceae bacterium]